MSHEEGRGSTACQCGRGLPAVLCFLSRYLEGFREEARCRVDLDLPLAQPLDNPHRAWVPLLCLPSPIYPHSSPLPAPPRREAHHPKVATSTFSSPRCVSLPPPFCSSVWIRVVHSFSRRKTQDCKLESRGEGRLCDPGVILQLPRWDRGCLGAVAVGEPLRSRSWGANTHIWRVGTTTASGAAVHRRAGESECAIPVLCPSSSSQWPVSLLQVQSRGAGCSQEQAPRAERGEFPSTFSSWCCLSCLWDPEQPLWALYLTCSMEQITGPAAPLGACHKSCSRNNGFQ